MTTETLPKPPPLQQLLDRHAIALWGNLRDRDQLDSAGAQAVIVESLQDLLDALKVDQKQTTANMNKLIHLSSRAVHALARYSFQPPPNGIAKTICIECGKLRKEHKPDCRIGQVQELASEMRIAFRAD